MVNRLALVFFFLLGICCPCRAQVVSMSTNALAWMELGTSNVGMSYAVSRHWTINAMGLYNPFRIAQRQLKQRTAAAGTRYWPWHVYSGWWASMGGRLTEFSEGGFVSDAVREGTRWGGGVAIGYSYMLARHFNLDIGAGLWAGRESYTKYACAVCGRVLDSGDRAFVLPDNLMIALAYVF